MRARRLLVSVLMGVAALAAVVTASANARRLHAPLVLRLRFRRAGTATGVAADSRYVVLSGRYSTTNGTPATLIDEQTGTRREISYPGCSPVTLGTPWLVYASCARDYDTTELYALPNGGWQAVHVRLGVGWEPVAIGTQWIEMRESCDEPTHCTNSYTFQNLQTGQTRSDPTNATTVVDLNSPTLTRKVCKPLRVPLVAGNEGSVTYAALPGSLTFYGKFAISSSGVNGAHGFLERCGSRLHQQIGSPNIPAGSLLGPAFAANSRLVVWQSARHQVSGLFLPSLRRFAIPLPSGINTQSSDGTGFPGTIAASSRHLYLLNWSDSSSIRSYWIAALPSTPK